MKNKIIHFFSSIILIFIILMSNGIWVYAATYSNSIKLNITSQDLAVINNAKINGVQYKNTCKLFATIINNNTNNNTVTWTSSNSNIAQVDNTGKVTAKASGTAIITAKTSNGKTATCNINVVFNGNNPGVGRFNSSILYSTVWPIIDKNLYENLSFNKKICTISKLTEAIIIETNSVSNANDYKFKIKTASGVTGWVDTENLLINLPDVRSDIIYNVKNASTQSLFKIGSTGTNISQVKAGTAYTSGYVNLPGITNKKLYTYDNYDNNQSDGKVWNSKIGREEYVCPVLYKFALKIGEAQNRAIQNGYCLKVYDGFRPQSVCNIFWDKGLEAIGANMDKNGKAIYINGSASMKSYSSRTESQKKATCLTGGYWTESYYNNSIPTVYANGYPMNISWFLSSSNVISDHARGTAIDLTMVYKDNRNKEINSQSSIDDLSLNSLTIYNTSDTNMLRNIMLSAEGMKPLISEWWHFNIEPTNTYAEGQVSFTNLYNFTTSINYSNTKEWSKDNVTVKITANRPLKTIPYDWSFVANSNNKSIQKTFTQTTNAHTIEIKDYKNRFTKININKIQIDKYVPQFSKITATGLTSAGNKTVTNTYVNNTLSGNDNIKNTQFIGDVMLKIDAKDYGGSGIKSYWISGTNGQTKTISQTTKNVKLTIYDNAGIEKFIYVDINIDKTKTSLNDKTSPNIYSVTGGKGKLYIRACDIGGILSKYTIDGKNWIDWPEGKSEVHLNIENKKIPANTIKVKDSAGNIGIWKYEVSTGSSI